MTTYDRSALTAGELALAHRIEGGKLATFRAACSTLQKRSEGSVKAHQQVQTWTASLRRLEAKR